MRGPVAVNASVAMFLAKPTKKATIRRRSNEGAAINTTSGSLSLPKGDCWRSGYLVRPLTLTLSPADGGEGTGNVEYAFLFNPASPSNLAGLQIQLPFKSGCHVVVFVDVSFPALLPGEQETKNGYLVLSPDSHLLSFKSSPHHTVTRLDAGRRQT